MYYDQKITANDLFEKYSEISLFYEEYNQINKNFINTPHKIRNCNYSDYDSTITEAFYKVNNLSQYKCPDYGELINNSIYGTLTDFKNSHLRLLLELKKEVIGFTDDIYELL